MRRDAFSPLFHRVVTCRRCLRLRERCARIATTKRKAFSDWDYWGRPVPHSLPRFGHLAEITFDEAPTMTLLGSHHPSRQNTQTGRLTPAMFEAVFERARNLLGDV